MRCVFVPEFNFITIGVDHKGVRLVTSKITSPLQSSACSKGAFEDSIDVIGTRKTKPEMDQPALFAGPVWCQFERNHICWTGTKNLRTLAVTEILAGTECRFIESD